MPISARLCEDDGFREELNPSYLLETYVRQLDN